MEDLTDSPADETTAVNDIEWTSDGQGSVVGVRRIRGGLVIEAYRWESSALMKALLKSCVGRTHHVLVYAPTRMSRQAWHRLGVVKSVSDEYIQFLR